MFRGPKADLFLKGEKCFQHDATMDKPFHGFRKQVGKHSHARNAAAGMALGAISPYQPLTSFQGRGWLVSWGMSTCGNLAEPCNSLEELRTSAPVTAALRSSSSSLYQRFRDHSNPWLTSSTGGLAVKLPHGTACWNTAQLPSRTGSNLSCLLLRRLERKDYRTPFPRLQTLHEARLVAVLFCALQV